MTSFIDFYTSTDKMLLWLLVFVVLTVSAGVYTLACATGSLYRRSKSVRVMVKCVFVAAFCVLMLAQTVGKKYAATHQQPREFTCHSAGRCS